MGCRTSKENEDGQVLQNRKINHQIKQDKMRLRDQVKLLLLGSGESGKSTVLKQMKLIHEGGYTKEERDSFKEIIYSNTVQSMRVILDAMEQMSVHLDTDKLKYRDVIYALPMEIEQEILPIQVAEDIRALWQDNHVQAVYQRNKEYQLNDSAKYFFDSIDRIGSKDYTPTNQDVLRARVKTTGIIETKFHIGDLTYHMLDVGGQRSERKKWIHCFEDVMAIIFLVALSEFDQVLIENEEVNRMEESLVLFDSICNSKWFKNTSIILFLNKIDLFREKIDNGHLLSDIFPDYRGPNTYEETSQYLMHRFLDLNNSKNKQVYTHFTCATDTNQMKFVMTAINDIIIQANLVNIGLL